ncbi:MAG: glucose-1-phosphate thymidylyltransferase, partial [Acidimicrobiales bacterium]
QPGGDPRRRSLAGMRALILCGGAGTRLRPITHTRAKQLVPVANKPILFYGLEAIAGAGIKDVGIIVGDTAAEVEEAVGDGSAWGLDVTFIPQEQPLGLAHCVLVAREWLGDEDFVLWLGDNLLQQDLRGFVDRFEADRAAAMAPTLTGGEEAPAAAQILLKRVPDPHRFGIAELDGGGRVVRLVEKPAEPASDLALVGVYLFDPRIHEAVASISPSARGELEITDAIQWLIDHGHRVRAEELEGWWIDTGKLTPLLDANRLLLEMVDARVEGEVDAESRLDGRVVVEAGARLVRSHVRGPAVIGPGSEVIDSFIGPFTAIGARCRIEGSEVEHSVVLDDSCIVDAGRIEDSLLGHHVSVSRSRALPRATRLMVGDHSQVAIDG